MVLLIPGIAYSDECSLVKREMAYGQAATEDATSKSGFKRAAEEFRKAIECIPSAPCVPNSLIANRPPAFRAGVRDPLPTAVW
jgi:hypothetical protein